MKNRKRTKKLQNKKNKKLQNNKSPKNRKTHRMKEIFKMPKKPQNLNEIKKK